MNVTDIYIYPIKSCQGIELKQAKVTPKGFAWDREFMLVNNQGKFLTQRQHSKLATIQIQIKDNTFTLSTVESSITFETTLSGQPLAVEVWRDKTVAIDQGDEVANWLKTILNYPCRLVRQSPDYIRSINPKYATSDREPVSFADGFPFLLTATASLAELNRRIGEIYHNNTQSVPMNRFRPNIVIKTDEPFIEGTWERINIGDVQFAVVKPCSRCIITTTDQFAGERNSLQEPLKTLQTFRHFSGGIMFGENMIPQTMGVVKVGDRIEVL